MLEDAVDGLAVGFIALDHDWLLIFIYNILSVLTHANQSFIFSYFG